MNIWINVGVVGGLIIVLILIRKALDKLFSKWFVPTAERIGKRLGTKVKKQSTIVIVEIFTLLILLMFVIGHLTLVLIMGTDGFFILYSVLMMIVFLVLILVSSAVIQEYKRLNPKYESSIGKGLRRIDIGKKFKSIYLLNRLWLLMEQSLDFFKSLMILQISLICLITLQWSPNFYFLSLCFIPLYANYWVYFVKVITPNTNSEGVFIRRAFMYLSLMALVIFEVFKRFQGYLIEVPYTPSINVFLLTSSGILYIAFDRVLKEILSDYLHFKKERTKAIELNERQGDWSI
ncbi:hypothetical protein BK125_17195 [Paenibacillus odorifer]|uniref:Uncharacterized protein n=1 Tax=Paenibacillus odorifer TaxID=189426 RepID=A0ABX3GPA5_9BACL|nr:hypothetical protein [Paenibacillus odorifer]OMC76789.1 hypothetical protein BK125_17195 [Paenibacillus odorifer]OMD33148.1 hypothetical protein BSO21_15715 [Paenibacillus odorifer]